MDGRNRLSIWLAAVVILSWLHHVVAMRPDRIAELRQQTVDMFYHGYDNYMDLAFPEDEVRLFVCLFVRPFACAFAQPNNSMGPTR